jgi:hypothetical protein
MIIVKSFIPFALIGIALMSSIPCLADAPVQTQAYQWKSVRMGGCGFVTGIVFHPTEKGLAYCRTDMGGAYRRDSETGDWIAITDWLPLEDVNLMGIESIALDPSDPNRVYMACGTNTSYESPDGAILRSLDRGKTFDVIRIPVKFGGNENGRGNGERMAVDPQNGAIIYLGTRWNGLLRSIDHGSTWQRVTSFPDMAEPVPAGLDPMQQQWWQFTQGGSGIIRVIFAPGNGDKGRTDTIYAAASLAGKDSLYITHDGGTTWTPLPGQPVREKLRPTDMDLGPEGNLYVSYGTNPGPYSMDDGAVWKYDTNTGAWTDITPVRSGSVPNVEHSRFGYCSVAVDPEKPGVVMAMPFWYVGGEEIFRSLDAGRTWKPIIRTCGRYDYSKIPFSAVPGIHWLFDVEVSPFDSDHLIFTTGFGGMETYDLRKADNPKATTADGNVWQPMMSGIEESVPLDMFSPKQGPTLVTAIGDYGGFIHYDLDKSPAEGNFSTPRFDNTTGLGVAWQKQNIYVRCGTSWKGKTGNIAFSIDSGLNWTAGTNIAEGARNGSVAISADGATCVWTPDSARKPGDWTVVVRSFVPYFTTDMGQTWTPCKGLPENTRVAADTVNPLKFYAFDVSTRTLYRSTDGARTFAAAPVTLPGGLPMRSRLRGDGRGGQDRIYLAPDRAGDIWLALFDGLYHINTDATTFSRIDGIDELRAFGFGKAAPGSAYHAVYIIGVVNGVRGIYRSDDMCGSYVKINDARQQWASLLLITGDMRRYGRVYIGAHGRGALYGDIAKESGGK